MAKTFMEGAILQSTSKADLNGALNMRELAKRVIKGVTDETEVQFVNNLTWYTQGVERVDLSRFEIKFQSGTVFTFHAALVSFRENSRPDRLFIYVSPDGIILTEVKAENERS